MLQLLATSWKGEASLPKAFWLTYVLAQLLLVIIILLLFICFVPHFSSSFLPNEHYYKNLVGSIILPYTIFAAIGVWRCGKNSKLVWRILSRIYVCFGILSRIAGLILLVIYYVRPSLLPPTY